MIMQMDESIKHLALGFSRQVAQWAASQGCGPEDTQVVSSLAYRLSLAVSEGHTCLVLSLALIEEFCPNQSLDSIRILLQSTGLVGEPGQKKICPLVLDQQNRLYLYRYFHYEERLAKALKNLAQQSQTLSPESIVSFGQSIAKLFGQEPYIKSLLPDWQKIAVAMALRQRLTIVSGGPGSGKTSTVMKILACLIEIEPHLRIGITAPTGKAAQRLLDTLRGERTEQLPQNIRDAFPKEAHTLHRLLGIHPTHHKSRFNEDNPLPFDVLVVDEASMMDLALATQLLEALPHTARLILLGDKDQLTAIEVGSVFAEISNNPSLSVSAIEELSAISAIPKDEILPLSQDPDSALADCVVWLQHNYRTRSDSRIASLSQYVNQGRVNETLALLNQPGSTTLSWINDDSATLGTKTLALALAGYQDYIEAIKNTPQDKGSIFSAVGRFRILCAIRETSLGIHEINQYLNRHLHQCFARPGRSRLTSTWYLGRAVIISKNHYNLKLFNGDIGLCLPDELGTLQVWFADASNEFRFIPCHQVPEHEEAYATTVHKAQGSEFESLLLILPYQSTKILSRQWLYTAVTRAREKVTICASEPMLRQALMQSTQRASGLLDRLMSR